MKQKLQTLLDQLNHGLVERENTLKTALLTVLTGENLVLIGPPGTGKSLIARRIADSLAHDGKSNDTDRYFEYLLTKFSTPEEIFGPLSITELKADRFKRNTAGYLPTVKVAFLDEIFKASSSILNSLLTILNERIYHNGSEPQDVPLQALIAASNELPTDQEELNALYDRFLVRSFVDYVRLENLPRLFEHTAPPAERAKLDSDDLERIQRAADSVTIPPEIVEAVQRIWTQHKETFKEDRRERLSDRRLKKVIRLLRVSAATNGRSSVDLSDVFLLKDCLWNHQDNEGKVRDLILHTLRAFSRPVPQGEQAVDEAPSPDAAHTSAERGTVVKGFKGSGTSHDPLLIQSVDDLMDLSRPDVGLKGYYFRQVADIDCSTLSSWTNISFKGHYDGGGHVVKYKKIDNRWRALFSDIQAQSHIANLRLEELRLADTAQASHVEHCHSTVNLIHTATECTISSCRASILIEHDATDCTITECQADIFLIRGTAAHCTISDCLVLLTHYWNDYGNVLSGIASYLVKDSVAERCFVAGTVRHHPDRSNYLGASFAGIAENCAGSHICQCAVGPLQLEQQTHLAKRIANVVDPSSKLENNASIDSNSGVDERDGKDGKTVAASLFKQRYLEHTLGWDFDAVWRWDEVNGRPVLRSIGMAAASHQGKTVGQGPGMTDLLTHQMRANIWV